MIHFLKKNAPAFQGTLLFIFGGCETHPISSVPFRRGFLNQTKVRQRFDRMDLRVQHAAVASGSPSPNGRLRTMKCETETSMEDGR